MPVLPQFTARQQLNGEGQSRFQPFQAQPGDGLQSVTKALDDLRAHQEKLSAQLDDDEAKTAAANYEGKRQAYWMERLESAKAEGSDGYTNRVLSEADKWEEENIKSLPYAAQQYAKKTFVNFKAGLHADAFNYELKSRNAKVISNFDDGLTQDATVVAKDPSLFNEMYVKRMGLLESLSLDEAQKVRLRSDAKKTLVYTAAQTIARNSPAEALAAIGRGGASFQWEGKPTEAQAKKLEAEAMRSDIEPDVRASLLAEVDRIRSGKASKPVHPALSMLPVEAYDSIEREARQALNHEAQKSRIGLADFAQDLQASIRAGVPVNEGVVAGVRQRYIKAFGMEEGQSRFADDIETPLMVSKSMEKMRGMSAAERATFVEQNKVVGVEGAKNQEVVYTSLQKANEYIAQALERDPALYTLQTSAQVGEAFNKAQAERNPAMRAKLMADYATRAKAEQSRLGVARVDLLPKQMVESIGLDFSQKPPKEYGQIITQLQNEWGKDWPTVFGQLTRDKAIPPAGLVIPNMKDDGARERMAAAASLTPEAIKTMLPPGEEKDIDAAVQEQMSDIGATFLNQGVGGLNTVSVFSEQAKKLAIYYRSQGMGKIEAAKKATDEALNWKYTVVDTYRVPKMSEKTGAPINAGLVSMGAATTLSTLGPTELFYSPRPIGNEAAKLQTVDAIKTNGFWVTNQDGSGLMLKVRDKNGDAFIVRDKAGKPIDLPFEKLEAAGNSREAVKKKMVQEFEQRPAAGLAGE